MNLLYLLIIIPLISFLILVCLGRSISKENIVIIGISTIGLLCLLVTFVCIDYQANTYPDTSLMYSRFLWEWFTIGESKISINLQLDGLSLIFLITISIFSLLIYFFAASYLTSTKDIYTFYAYANLLISSLFLLVLADNLFILFLAWEGISLSSYLLIGLYYQKRLVSYSAIKTFIIMNITDSLLLLGIFLVYNELNTLNIRDILILANENLAIDSEIIFWATSIFLFAVIGKAGVFPFHTYFTETAIAPIPVTAMLQSVMAVLSSGYFMLRFSSLFMMSSDVFVIMGVIASIALLFSTSISLVQNNIKSLVTYINLGQISYLFLGFMIPNWVLSLNYIITYCVTSSLLLLSSAILIKVCNGEQNIHKLGGLYHRYPLLYFTFLLSAASICAMPWIMSTFYTKGDIIWGLVTKDRMGIGIIALIGVLLSTLSIFRLIFTVFHHKQKLTTFTQITRYSYAPVVILAILSTAMFNYLPLPIQGIIPFVDLNTNNQLMLQILLAAITVLSVLIAYILYFDANPEIRELSNTPIGKALLKFCHNGWYFESLIYRLFVVPYHYLSQLIKKDPLSQWNKIIDWGIKKVNFQVELLENGRLRWYIMSIVGGSIIILLLLILF